MNSFFIYLQHDRTLFLKRQCVQVINSVKYYDKKRLRFFIFFVVRLFFTLLFLLALQVFGVVVAFKDIDHKEYKKDDHNNVYDRTHIFSL